MTIASAQVEVIEKGEYLFSHDDTTEDGFCVTHIRTGRVVSRFETVEAANSFLWGMESRLDGEPVPESHVNDPGAKVDLDAFLELREEVLSVAHDEAKCNRCGEAILWISLMPNKKNHPVNTVPSAKGTILVKRGKNSSRRYGKVLDAAERLEHGKLYVSHFGTCEGSE